MDVYNMIQEQNCREKKIDFFLRHENNYAVISKELIRLTDSKALMPVDVTLLVEGLQVPTMIDMNP